MIQFLEYIVYLQDDELYIRGSLVSIFQKKVNNEPT